MPANAEARERTATTQLIVSSGCDASRHNRHGGGGSPCAGSGYVRYSMFL